MSLTLVVLFSTPLELANLDSAPPVSQCGPVGLCSFPHFTAPSALSATAAEAMAICAGLNLAADLQLPVFTFESDLQSLIHAISGSSSFQ